MVKTYQTTSNKTKQNAIPTKTKVKETNKKQT